MTGSVAGFACATILVLVDDLMVAGAASSLVEAAGSIFAALDAMPAGLSGAVGGASADPTEAGCSDRERARRGT
jgi:hypothetical protein